MLLPLYDGNSVTLGILEYRVSRGRCIGDDTKVRSRLRSQEGRVQNIGSERGEEEGEERSRGRRGRIGKGTEGGWRISRAISIDGIGVRGVGPSGLCVRVVDVHGCLLLLLERNKCLGGLFKLQVFSVV